MGICCGGEKEGGAVSPSGKFMELAAPDSASLDVYAKFEHSLPFVRANV